MRASAAGALQSARTAASAALRRSLSRPTGKVYQVPAGDEEEYAAAVASHRHVGDGSAGANYGNEGGVVGCLRSVVWTDAEGKTTLLMTAVNFMNGVVGAGIIGLPSVLNRAGFIVGILLCVGMALVANATLKLLAYLGAAHGTPTYEALAERAWGGRGYYLVCTFQVLIAAGAMIGYLVIFADTLTGVVITTTTAPPAWATDRRVVLVLGALLGLLPLTLLRHYGALAKFAVVKAGAITLLAAAVVALHFQVDVVSVHDAAWKYTEAHAGVLPAMGTVAFAFVCHHLTFLAYGSLQGPSKPRFAAVVNLSVGATLVLSLTLAIAGYLTFFENTAADIVTNFLAVPAVAASPLLNAARVMLALNMLLTYPGEAMIVRHTAEALLARYRAHRRWQIAGSPVYDIDALAALQRADDADAAAGHWTPRHGCTRPLLRHVGLTVAIVAVTLGVALATDDLGRVLDITGSFAAVFIAFLLPAAIRLRLGATPTDTRPPCHPTNAACWLLLAFGTFAFVASTGLSLYSLATGDSVL